MLPKISLTTESYSGWKTKDKKYFFGYTTKPASFSTNRVKILLSKKFTCVKYRCLKNGEYKVVKSVSFNKKKTAINRAKMWLEKYDKSH